ncbi:tetratricopeptide repeat protein [Lysobacter korlensis]|uniref:Tetratricopeptide repeat protein n=1 Tax=Lysobacter korlensis TaxID=553636 RepID=A0ABV6S3N6_9GAMM
MSILLEALKKAEARKREAAATASAPRDAVRPSAAGVIALAEKTSSSRTSESPDADDRATEAMRDDAREPGVATQPAGGTGFGSLPELLSLSALDSAQTPAAAPAFAPMSLDSALGLAPADDASPLAVRVTHAAPGAFTSLSLEPLALAPMEAESAVDATVAGSSAEAMERIANDSTSSAVDEVHAAALARDGSACPLPAAEAPSTPTVDAPVVDALPSPASRTLEAPTPAEPAPSIAAAPVTAAGSMANPTPSAPAPVAEAPGAVAEPVSPPPSASPQVAAAPANAPAASTAPVTAPDAAAAAAAAKAKTAKPTKLALPQIPRRIAYAAMAVAVAGALGGGAYWLHLMGVPPFGTTPSMVAVVPPPSSMPAGPAAPTLEVAVDGTPATAPGMPVSAEPSPTTPAADIAPPAPQASPAMPTVAPVLVAPAPQAAPNLPTSGTLDAPEQSRPARSALETPVDELDLRPEPLRVQRRNSPSHLLAGYAALQAGRIDDAEASYRAALSAQPGELDALLGLAVIAETRGDTANAEQLYRRVLAQQPEHPQAVAGLLAVSGSTHADDETSLRQTLSANPDAASLHAALGARMAAQGRWADAQSAYFEAHSREPGNADHVYNLAVALDQLQQPRLAADHYRRALGMGDGAARFDRNAASARLDALTIAGAHAP